MLAGFFSGVNGGVVIRQDRRKLILRSDDPPGIGMPLCIKIYLQQGLLPALRETLTRSAGERSIANCRRLADAGIHVPEPYGAAIERGPFGLLSRSLAATQWIGDMASLRDHTIPLFGTVSDGDPSVAALARSLGAFVAALHERGIWVSDLNSGNLLVRRRQDGTFSVILVDHDDIAFPGTVYEKQRLANLSQVAALLLPLGSGTPEQVCAGYAPVAGTADAAALARDVSARAAAVLVRWKRDLDARFSRVGSERRSALR